MLFLPEIILERSVQEVRAFCVKVGCQEVPSCAGNRSANVTPGTTNSPVLHLEAGMPPKEYAVGRHRVKLVEGLKHLHDEQNLFRWTQLATSHTVLAGLVAQPAGSTAAAIVPLRRRMAVLIARPKKTPHVDETVSTIRGSSDETSSHQKLRRTSQGTPTPNRQRHRQSKLSHKQQSSLARSLLSPRPVTVWTRTRV